MRDGGKKLRFYDALDRADGDALGGIVETDTFHASCSINDVDGIAFGDGIGWAFRQACTAGNAFVCDFHCHDRYSYSCFLLFFCNFSKEGVVVSQPKTPQPPDL
jgi:hypothetical protein